MGKNHKLTGVALSVATVFGVLASGSAIAGPLDTLPIPQVIVNPPTNSVSIGLAVTGTSPLGSVTVAAGGAGELFSLTAGEHAGLMDRFWASSDIVSGR